MNADVPLGVRLFGIGGHLAELIVDLRGDADRQSTAPAAQQLIDRLNRDFGNLREVLQSSNHSLAAALIQPVMDRLVETLAAVAAADPGLWEKCDTLTNIVSRLLEFHPLESIEDGEDPGFPF